MGLVIGGLFVSIVIWLLLSLGVYVYDDFSIIIFLVVAYQGFSYFVIPAMVLKAAVTHTDDDEAMMLLTTPLVLIVFGVVSSYIFFLAETWDKDLVQWHRDVLSVPFFILDFILLIFDWIGGFFVELFVALGLDGFSFEILNDFGDWIARSLSYDVSLPGIGSVSMEGTWTKIVAHIVIGTVSGLLAKFIYDSIKAK